MAQAPTSHATELTFAPRAHLMPQAPQLFESK